MRPKPYAELRGLIVARFHTILAFAKAMELSPSTISAKLNGRTEWTAVEIVRACELLGVPLENAYIYFFCVEC